MFIQTEETPNPATLKFLPGRDVLGQGTLDIGSAQAATRSPLAEALFAVGGVKSVFLGADFVTVTKDDGKSWAALKAPLLAAIMEHFSSGKPVLADAPEAAASSGKSGARSDDPIVAQICDLLDHKIRPAVAQDGGDITFDRYEDGVVYLHLKGSCSGCPSSAMTLKAGVENLLRHYIPEIREVRQAS